MLHRVVPVVHSRTWTCPKLSAGDAVRAPAAAGTANGVTHQISSFSMGRTRGQVYKTGLGEEPTGSGKASCRSLQSRGAPRSTQHRGPGLLQALPSPHELLLPTGHAEGNRVW